MIRLLTQKWWEEVAPLCGIYVSQYATIEAGKGSPLFAQRRQEAMSEAMFLDGMIDNVRSRARTLLEVHAVPESEPTDALHIATATLYSMDVLLTWNCRHMANPVALPKTISTISKAGYECPIIITPKEFLERQEEFNL